MAVIAIDYDKTITADFEAAKNALQKLKEQGWTIIIYSCRNNHILNGNKRSNELLQEMRDTLALYNVPYSYIDYGLQGKVYADFYVDDKAIHFSGDWKEVLEAIDERTC